MQENNVRFKQGSSAEFALLDDNEDAKGGSLCGDPDKPRRKNKQVQLSRVERDTKVYYYLERNQKKRGLNKYGIV